MCYILVSLTGTRPQLALIASFFYYPFPIPLLSASTGRGSLLGCVIESLILEGSGSQWSHLVIGGYSFPFAKMASLNFQFKETNTVSPGGSIPLFRAKTVKTDDLNILGRGSKNSARRLSRIVMRSTSPVLILASGIHIFGCKRNSTVY